MGKSGIKTSSQPHRYTRKPEDNRNVFSGILRKTETVFKEVNVSQQLSAKELVSITTVKKVENLADEYTSNFLDSKRSKIKKAITTGNRVIVNGRALSTKNSKPPKLPEQPHRYTKKIIDNKKDFPDISNNLKGWVGEIDSNTTTDTGTEAMNVSVLPSSKKITSISANKVVDSLVDKATSNLLSSKKHKVKQAINAGKKVKVNGSPASIKGTKTKRTQIANRRVRRETSSSNAHIDKLKTNDSGIEAIQGLRASRDKVKGGISTVHKVVDTGRALGVIATRRDIKPQILHRRNNDSFTSFYTTNAQVDKSKTNDSGIESVHAVRIGVNKSKNIGVGVKNTHIGVKKTFATGKEIHTKTKTVVRNTKKTKNSIKNAKSTADKISAVRDTTIRSIKVGFNTIKALFNPVVLKIVAVILALFLVIFTMQTAITSIVNVFNSTFGWLIPSETSLPADTLSNYKQKIVAMADEKNSYYSDASKLNVDSVSVTGRINPEIYKDVLAILIVQKQSLYAQKVNDPNNIYDLSNMLDFSQRELEYVFSKFYSVNVQNSTYTTTSTSSSTNKKKPTPTPSITTHKLATVTITNYTANDVMTKLKLSDEEKESVYAIRSGIDTLILTALSDIPDSEGSDLTVLANIVVSPTAYPQGNINMLYGDVDVNTTFAGRLAALAESKKQKIYIESGYRSIEEQQEIWDATPMERRGKYVAKPGNSRHQYKLAADVSGWVKNLTNEELKPFGLYKRMPYEDWHIEPVETKGF